MISPKDSGCGLTDGMWRTWKHAKVGGVAVDAKEFSGKVAAQTLPPPQKSAELWPAYVRRYTAKGPSLERQLSGVDGGGKRRSCRATDAERPPPARTPRVIANPERIGLRPTSASEVGVVWEEPPEGGPAEEEG